MLIGIISDSHDDMVAIRKTVDILNSEGVFHAIHAGDITSPFTFEVFSELTCGISAIFGNNDGDKILLKERFKGNIHNQPFITTVQGRKIVVLHEPDLVDALAESRYFDVVIYGHTHSPDIRKVKDTLVINPGKVARLHKGESTLALLDVEKMQAEIVVVP
ncbi:MAG TPA: YfcE family phosphodiesterase [Nitrospiraceae bacterium]|jgi:putative phosphoesterase|nr:YfcE family phosphodiesterase [Nitrospiraceae bacterium]